jgi:hypothetical protein
MLLEVNHRVREDIHKGHIFRIYKEQEKTTNRKIGTRFEQVTTEDTEMADKHVKKCSSSLITRKMQIKTTKRSWA